MVLPPWQQTKITVRTTKQEFEVADVIRQFEAAYRQRYPVTPQQARVLAALKACRTAALGGHIYECRECGALEFVYHSCRDRHCMKCGKFKKAEWLERQKVVLLPIPYFHITHSTSSGQALHHGSRPQFPGGSQPKGDLRCPILGGQRDVETVCQKDLWGDVGDHGGAAHLGPAAGPTCASSLYCDRGRLE